MGVRCSMDTSRTGYSGLSYLVALPDQRAENSTSNFVCRDQTFPTDRDASMCEP